MNTIFYLALLLLPWSTNAITETPTRYEIESHIKRVAVANSLPPSWVAGIAQCESNFDLHAIGDNGRSKGLWQFQDETYKEQGGENINDWKEQTHLAIKLLVKGQWWRWYNCSLGKKKKIEILDSFTLNSCMAYLWNVKGIKIKGDARDIKMNTTTPVVGFVMKLKYPHNFHAAFIEQIGTSTISISETNYKRGKFTQREIQIGDPAILGYYTP